MEVRTTPPQELSLSDEFGGVKTTPQEEADLAAYSLRSKSKTAPSAKGVRPKLLSDSDSDINYDDYLDQLVDEEEEEEPGEEKGGVALSLSSALSGDFPLLGDTPAVPSLEEELSGAFPLINGSTGGGQEEGAGSLQALVGIEPGTPHYKALSKRGRHWAHKVHTNLWLLVTENFNGVWVVDSISQSC